jgi:hypothetical protein
MVRNVFDIHFIFFEENITKKTQLIILRTR